MKKGFLICFITVIFLVVNLSNSGQEEAASLIEKQSMLASDPDLILFKASPFDPVHQMLFDEQFGFSNWRDADEGSLYYVVQFPGVPSDQDRELLNSYKAEIVHYIPNNAYLIKIDSKNYEIMKQENCIRTSFRLPKWAKIDPIIFETKQDPVELDIIPVPGNNTLGIANFLMKNFPEIKLNTKREHHESGTLVCSVSATSLKEFLDYLFFIVMKIIIYGSEHTATVYIFMIIIIFSTFPVKMVCTMTTFSVFWKMIKTTFG